MNRFVLAALAAILLATGSASAGDQKPTTDDTPSERWCDEVHCECSELLPSDCFDMVEESCDSLDENWGNREVADRLRDGDHPLNSWLDCDPKTRTCSCPIAKAAPRNGRRTERAGSGEKAANDGKTAAGGDTAGFDEADALFGRRTEVVAANRGTPTKAPAKEEDGKQEPTMGAIHSDAAPPISGDMGGKDAVREAEVDHRRKAAEAERRRRQSKVTDHRQQPTGTTDHRGSGSENTTDHRGSGDENTTDHRWNGDGRTTDHRESEAAPRRDKTTETPQGNLEAPSDLTLSDVGSTSLTLSWHDNATTEYGVYVERGTPTRERGGINYHWQQVFAVEERVMSRVEGTGQRSDMDDGLKPGQQYCYRLRAYRGQGESKSDYSEIACATTR